jgi:hypothetical protein
MSKTMHSVPCSILCGLLMALGGCEHVAEPAARDRAPLAEPRMASARELAGLPVDSPGKPSGPIGVRHRDLRPDLHQLIRRRHRPPVLACSRFCYG